MIVISNTSPLTNLAAVGQLTLLHRLYNGLHIPDGVWEELNAEGQSWPGRDEVAAVNWIEKHPVRNQSLVTALQRDLGRGEAESIALALELSADLLLLDEREGRRAAERLGLRVIGVVGILLEAKSSAIIDKVRPLLDGLRQAAGFYLSESLYQHALVLAGESTE